MKVLSSSYNSKKKIYDGHLQEIRGISFTPREIDIIACILHNRGEKKIASLLSISPRTVGSHVHNIMLKLGCNSREYITDLVEKSGKLPFINQYYLHILIVASFEQRLRTIGKTINRTELICFIEYPKISDEFKGLFHTLKAHLRLANVILTEKRNNSEEIRYTLYVSTEKVPPPQSRDDHIFLIVGNSTYLPESSKEKYVDFSTEANYYFSTLILIEKISGVNQIHQILQEFIEEYRVIQSSSEGYSNENAGVANNLGLKFIAKGKNIVFVICGIVLIGVLASIVKPLIQIPNPATQALKPNLNHTVNTPLSVHEKLAEYVKYFSADNANKDAIYSNQSIIKEVEGVVGSILNDKEQIFDKDKFSSEQLANFLYNLQALAGYYTTHEHSGAKARQTLKYGKDLAESYVVSRSRVPINFDKLDKEEIYAELATIKDLPELYTRIIYKLGRSYIYDGDRKHARPYFEVSQYLGNKLGLFEGYLSSRNGLGVMLGDEINIDLEQHNYDAAQKKLDKVITLYEQLRTDSTEYRIGYRPNNIEPELIIPKQDIINEVECSEQLAKYYTKLMLITKDIQQQEKYIAAITNQFVGDKEFAGLFKQSRELWGLRLASVYNILGNIMLKAYDAHIDLKQLRTGVIQELNLVVGNKGELEIIEQIFDFAKLQSRSTEYTKADSYDGLLRVYRRQIEQMQSQEEAEKKVELLKKIAILQNKRDNINKELDRKCKYEEDEVGGSKNSTATIKCSF